MALNEPWSIKSRAHICAVTEKHFTDGESFYTALFPDPASSDYLRKDFSAEVWENRSEEDETPFSFWSSIYHAPVKDEKVEVTDESPEDLLRRLIEEDLEHTENARYILAIMLERKKLLVEADSQPIATGIIRIYEHRKTGDVFIVKDPNIPLSEVEKVQDQVSTLLENGGREPEPEEESAANEQESRDGNQESTADDDEAPTVESGDGIQVTGEPESETEEAAVNSTDEEE